jgi:putative YphP/YqiW family bacilliredoxin
MFVHLQIKNISSMYPADLTNPMTRDLTEAGFESLHTPADVDMALSKAEGTALLVVNSVCGCAAAMARPGTKLALLGAKSPDRLYTVFAGVDREATERARDYLLPYPPSSPSIALLKNGRLVHFLERHHIEGRSAQMIAENLKAAFEEYC